MWRRERVVTALVVLCLSAPIAWYYLAWALGMTTMVQSVDIAAVFLGLAGILAGAIIIWLPDAAMPRRVAIASAVFLIWAAVSSVASGRGWTAFMGEPENGLGLLVIGALVGAAAATGRDASAAARVLGAVAPWIVAAETALVAYQLTVGMEAAGTLPNSTYLGEFLVLLLPWALIGWDGTLERGWIARLAAAAAGVSVLAATGSRVAFAAAVVWFAWVVLRRKELARGVRVAVALSIVVASSALALAFAGTEVLGSAQRAALGLRPELWLTSARAVVARPLLGWGPDGLLAGGSASTTLQMARDGRAFVMQPGGPDPHSIVLWVAVSMGVVGVLLLGWLTVEIARAYAARDTYGDRRTAGAWALGMLAIVALTAPLALQIIPVVAAVIGASLGRSRSDSEGRDSPQRLARVAGVLLLVASLGLLVSAATRAPLEIASATTSPRLAPIAERATDLLPFDAHLAALAGHHWRFSGGYGGAGDVARQVAALERAVRLDRRNPYHPLDLALAEAGADRGGEAAVERSFAESYRRYPFHPFARAEHARLLAQWGRTDDAETELAVARMAKVAEAPQLQPVIDAAEQALRETR